MKKYLKTLSTVSLLILSMTSLSQASGPTGTNPENPSLSRGVRPLGMGNAFVAMPGVDENAFFYNPAAINDYSKTPHFRILSPAFDMSTGIVSLIKDVKDLANTLDSHPSTSDKTDDFNSFVNTHTGEFETAQVRLPLLTVMHKWFAASLLGDSRTTISFRNRTFTNIELFSQNDLGGVIGGAYGFFDDRLQAGVNLKVIHRVSIDQVITVDDIISNSDFNTVIPRKRATGVGVDLGLKGKIPTFDLPILDLLKPTAAFAWQDVGNTRFGNGVANTPQSITLGFGVHPEWNKWQFHIENDFREINQSKSFLNKWNIGAEVMAPRLAKFFQPSVRVGGNQGYLAAGASLDFRFFKLEFATYGQEAGTYSHSKQIRRIAGNISFGL
ncbi:MAG: hypothetical protein IPJ69_05290 [Deltaproteobacteria bacterium]|nr:MAG: hypothetical protein IPJ69_05290 [Deltaproteobacteria bacterium]